MTMDRANPFADLNEFQAKPKPKPIEKAKIEQLAQENGFPSRQPVKSTPEKITKPEKKANRRGRRYTTGRNQQINIKATSETIEKLYKIADREQIPLGKVLELAIDAMETRAARETP